MAVNTKIAPRRWPFPVGTRQLFIQASPPTDWTQDVASNDRFLRVVNTVGGNTGGPDNTTTGLNNQTLTHTHSIPSHNHSLQNHVHDVTHHHPMPSTTRRMYDGLEGALDEGSENYEAKDDNNGYGDFNSNGIHLGVDTGNNDEGNHDHVLGGNTLNYSANSDVPTTANTNSVSGTSGSVNLDHFHSVDSNFRPKYKDVVHAVLVQ